MKMFGQASTSYAVLLAIVLVLLVGVIILFTVFGQSAAENRVKASIAYWRAMKPIGIEDVSWVQQGYYWYLYAAPMVTIVNNERQAIGLEYINLTDPDDPTRVTWQLLPEHYYEESERPTMWLEPHEEVQLARGYAFKWGKYCRYGNGEIVEYKVIVAYRTELDPSTTKYETSNELLAVKCPIRITYNSSFAEDSLYFD